MEGNLGFFGRRQKSVGLLKRRVSRLVRYVLLALLNVPMYFLYATDAWIAFLPYFLLVACIICLAYLHLWSNHGLTIFIFLFGFISRCAVLLVVAIYDGVFGSGRCAASSYSRTLSASYTDVDCFDWYDSFDSRVPHLVLLNFFHSFACSIVRTGMLWLVAFPRGC